MRSRRPQYFDSDNLCRSQSEVQAFIVCGLVASSGRGETSLCVYLHPGAEAVTIAPRATQCNRKPMRGSATIHEHLRVAAQDGRHCIDLAIIVEIAKRRTPSRR